MAESGSSGSRIGGAYAPAIRIIPCLDQLTLRGERLATIAVTEYFAGVSAVAWCDAVGDYSAAMRWTATLPVGRFDPTDRVS